MILTRAVGIQLLMMALITRNLFGQDCRSMADGLLVRQAIWIDQLARDIFSMARHTHLSAFMTGKKCDDCFHGARYVFDSYFDSYSGKKPGLVGVVTQVLWVSESPLVSVLQTALCNAWNSPRSPSYCCIMHY